jgi:hypothetical protein
MTPRAARLDATRRVAAIWASCVVTPPRRIVDYDTTRRRAWPEAQMAATQTLLENGKRSSRSYHEVKNGPSSGHDAA